MSCNESKFGMYVQTIFFDILVNFEISVFDIPRAKFATTQIRVIIIYWGVG